VLIGAAALLAVSLPASSATADKPAQTEKVTAAPALTGTLFFSDKERARLDQIRNRPKTAVTIDGEPDDGRSVINGYVRRSDGRITVWVDGAPSDQTDKQLTSKITPMSVGTTLADARISVSELPTTSAPAESSASKLQVRQGARGKKPAAKKKSK
jgi:hypothetical protein